MPYIMKSDCNFMITSDMVLEVKGSERGKEEREREREERRGRRGLRERKGGV